MDDGRLRACAKRCFDLVVVVGTAFFWLPLLGVLAALVRLNMGPNVMFKQRRPGKDGKSFDLVKFRTMRDGEECNARVLPDEERVTPFGRRLRATSLDELPELINVLRGEMSLVGPRPLLVRYLDRYTPEQRRRHEVKPGLTGWAQINGRNALSWEEKFRLDVWYVDHQSWWLDLKILALTVIAVLCRHGVDAPGRVGMKEFMGNSGKRSEL